MSRTVGLTFDEPKKEQAAKAKTKADYIADAKTLGVEVPKKATLDQIMALIAEASSTSTCDVKTPENVVTDDETASEDETSDEVTDEATQEEEKPLPPLDPIDEAV